MKYNDPNKTYISPKGRPFKVSAVGNDVHGWYSDIKFADDNSFARVRYGANGNVNQITKIKT